MDILESQGHPDRAAATGRNAVGDHSGCDRRYAALRYANLRAVSVESDDEDTQAMIRFAMREMRHDYYSGVKSFALDFARHVNSPDLARIGALEDELDDDDPNAIY
jgi:hypothetical protein